MSLIKHTEEGATILREILVSADLPAEELRKQVMARFDEALLDVARMAAADIPVTEIVLRLRKR